MANLVNYLYCLFEVITLCIQVTSLYFVDLRCCVSEGSAVVECSRHLRPSRGLPGPHILAVTRGPGERNFGLAGPFTWNAVMNNLKCNTYSLPAFIHYFKHFYLSFLLAHSSRSTLFRLTRYINCCWKQASTCYRLELPMISYFLELRLPIGRLPSCLFGGTTSTRRLALDVISNTSTSRSC